MTFIQIFLQTKWSHMILWCLMMWNEKNFFFKLKKLPILTHNQFLTDIIMIICYTEIHSRDTSSIEYFRTWLSNITWIVCFHLLRSKQLSKAKQAVPPTQTRDTPSSTTLRAELWRSSPTVYCVSSFSCEKNWTNNIIIENVIPI